MKINLEKLKTLSEKPWFYPVALFLFRRDKALPQFVEVGKSQLAPQPEGLPCTEQAALALRFRLVLFWE